jgi:hypothetical protein
MKAAERLNSGFLGVSVHGVLEGTLESRFWASCN